VKREKFVEFLLRLYPPGFREQYEEEMRDVIRRDAARGRATGAVGLTVNGLLAWLDFGRRSLSKLSLLDLRALKKAPAFGVVVVVVVAAAIALGTAAAGFVRGTLLRTPCYPEPERLVFAWGSNPANGQLRDVVSGPNFLDLRRESEILESLAALHPGSAVLLKDGRPEVLEASEVTVDFLHVLGVPPLFGRDFGEEHRTSAGPRAVILSHRFWLDHFGGDESAIRGTLVLNGAAHSVLGVLRPELDLLGRSQVLLPLREDALESEERTFHNYWLLGRLAPGASEGAATRELSAIFTRIAARDPRLAEWSVLVERVDEISVSGVRPLLLAIGGAVLLVVFAAAANLASLSLVRTLARTREIFVRRAMGARGGEIATLLLGETAVLTASGAALGVILGVLLLDWLAGIVPANVPIPGSAASVAAVASATDAPTLAAGAVLALLMWVAMSVPSLLARPLRGLRLVVAVELALATMLLVGAGFLSRAADRLLAVDPGVDPEGLLTLYVGQLEGRDAASRTSFYRDVVLSVKAVPGVVGAGLVDYAPFQGEDDFMGFRLLDRPPAAAGHNPREEWRRVSADYFSAAGIAVRRGRGFEARDYEVPPAVAVVNEAFAKKYWPNAEAIGQRMRLGQPEYPLLEVVGIVEDVPERGPSEPAPPMFFAPLQGYPRANMALFVRAAGEPLSVLEGVKEAVWSVDSSEPIDRVFPMEALLQSTVALPRLARKLVSLFAIASLALGALGLFGVSSYAVRSRRKELGIRLAIGATPRRLKRDLLLDFAPVAALGLFVGIAFGVIAAYLSRALLHGISPLDPWALAGAASAVSIVALLSTHLAGRGIAEVDPSRSLSSPAR
jgi:predicted permease